MTETVTDTTLTLDEIRNRVYFLAKESKTSALFPCYEVTDVVNMALGKVFNAIDQTYLVAYRNTCCGVEGYVIPDAKLLNGNAVVDQVWICDEEISPSNYVEWVCCTDTKGIPTLYWVNGNTVHLNPIPDTCYPMKLRYRMEFRKLAACSDKPHMSDIQIDAATFYAVHILKAKDEEYAASNFFKAMYDETMAEAMLIPPGVYSGDQSYGGAL